MRLVGLSEAGIEQLRPVLEEERRAWVDTLHWDYRPALDLIARFVEAGTLPGFALEDDAGAVGYSYYVTDRPVAFVGGLYLKTAVASSELYAPLLERVVYTIRQQPGIQRIESQVFPFNMPLEPLFLGLGFHSVRRSFLLKTLTEPSPGPGDSPFQIQRWDPRSLRDAAEVIFDSYQGAPDQRLCRDYQSRGGCLRFLRNLVENPACGLFDAENSLMATDERGLMCGILLTSRIRDDVGMVPQLSVRRTAQGRGLGGLMLAHYFENGADSGLSEITLSVSDINVRAVRLYERLGFRRRRRFHAFLWER